MNEIEKTEQTPAQLARSAETAQSAQAAQAEAAIKAAFAIAARFPRDFDLARQRLLTECKRPSFAAAAEYSVPRAGTKIVGPSIRFAEAAVRCMGNIRVNTSIVYDDDEKRIVKVTATDLESNLEFGQDVAVRKVIERSKVFKDQKVLRERTNSSGSKVYLVAATEDEVQMVTAAAVSKSIRTTALRLVPGDLVAEAMRQCHFTVKDADAKDPEGMKKLILDTLAEEGVTAERVKMYLGHDMTKVSSAEREDLRRIITSMREGGTWADLTDQKEGQAAPPPPQEKPKEQAAPAAATATPEKEAPPPPQPPAPEAQDPGNPLPPRQPPPQQAEMDEPSRLALITSMKRMAAKPGQTKVEFCKTFALHADSRYEDVKAAYGVALKAIKK